MFFHHHCGEAPWGHNSSIDQIDLGSTLVIPHLWLFYGVTVDFPPWFVGKFYGMVDAKAVTDTPARCGHESGLEGCEDNQCGFGRYECLGFPGRPGAGEPTCSVEKFLQWGCPL